jgi:hypothetical protein
VNNLKTFLLQEIKMNKVNLKNTGPVNSGIPNVYFPRLQVNKRGEIVLATSKTGSLTTGILVAKTPESTSKIQIGQKFDDWEVAGELTDYNGEVSVTFENQVKV